jgi:hypothetical protein
MTEAMAGPAPAPVDSQDPHQGAPAPGSTPREVAEEARRAQEAQHTGKHDGDRDGHLVQIGRGQQTHG